MTTGAEPVIGRNAIARMLNESGIDTVFTVAGGHFLPTYHEMGQLGTPTVIPARHEQGAGYMASGYALSSGRPGVVLTGAPGPGATNVVTAVANAHADSIPLLVITAQVDRRYIHRNILQYCDNVGLLAPFCKSSTQAVSLEEIPNLLATGLQLAASGRPGPVHIALPQNLQADRITGWNPVPVMVAEASPPPRAAIAAAAEALAASRRPAILAGHGVIRGGGTAALAELAERLAAPVATSRSGVGSIPTSHPSSVGMLGFYGPESSRDAVAGADVVVVAGCALGEQTTFGWRPSLFADDATIIQIDIDASQINRNYRSIHGIVADAGLAIAELAAAVDQTQSRRQPWFDQRPQRTEPQNDPAKGLSAATFLQALNRHTGGAIVCSADIGNHRLWVCEQLDVTRPDGLLQSCEFDAMGFSLPAAIGASVAGGGSRVVSISGDGGFVHTMGELAVAKDLGLPVVAVVFVDGALGILKHQAEEFYGEDHFVSLGDIDFAALAAAFGVESHGIDDASQLDKALEAALSADGPTLLAVTIDPDEVFPPLRVKIEQRKIDLLGSTS
ncbi:MAG: thiamine pyrophosphate-binding protein [Acidimicrobiia bacterium]|nr:thiamine pyrophosphate-binding protein [Acidimicrobiia bacterium]